MKYNMYTNSMDYIQYELIGSTVNFFWGGGGGGGGIAPPPEILGVSCPHVPTALYILTKISCVNFRFLNFTY